MSNSEIISNALSQMGFVGAVIAGLLIAISALGTVVVYLYRRNNVQNDWNREENKAFIKLAESINNAMNRTAEVNDDRNRATEELADAIKGQARTFELVVERLQHYHDMNVDRLERLREVVSSLSEAMRVNNGVLTTNRETTAGIVAGFGEIKTKFDTLLVRLLPSPRRPRRRK